MNEQRHPMQVLVDQLAQVDSALLAAAVSMLPADVLLAAKVGAEIGYARHGQMLADDWPGGRHHRPNPTIVSQLQRYRYPPNGDRDEWIKWGPAGAPHSGAPTRRAAA
ncbi:hypothetical protein ACQEVB_11650 [Pseudonocardia sp. CA-107938]|uniref:hypothetical protein n=1 Tax=Pseudonocardia sp. CA-107938 TaxID=3240021 RepID=UPI003D922880